MELLLPIAVFASSQGRDTHGLSLGLSIAVSTRIPRMLNGLSDPFPLDFRVQPGTAGV